MLMAAPLLRWIPGLTEERPQLGVGGKLLLPEGQAAVSEQQSWPWMDRRNFFFYDQRTGAGCIIKLHLQE